LTRCFSTAVNADEVALCWCTSPRVEGCAFDIPGPWIVRKGWLD
jgi:hypothetical protein